MSWSGVIWENGEVVPGIDVCCIVKGSMSAFSVSSKWYLAEGEERVAFALPFHDIADYFCSLFWIHGAGDLVVAQDYRPVGEEEST